MRKGLIGLTVGVAALAAAAGAQAQSANAPRWLMGYWTDSAEACTDMIEFRRDGTFFTEGNGGSGRWQLVGNQLTFTAASSITARIERLSRDSIRLHHRDGSVGHSYRCTGDSTPTDRPLNRP